MDRGRGRCKRELDKEERGEWGGLSRGDPAGLSWPSGGVGYLYTQHLNTRKGGGGGEEQP